MTAPQYRYRGSVQPSAAVSRPVRGYRNATREGASEPTSATLDIFDVIDSYGGWWGIAARDVDAALAQIGDVDTLYVRINSPGGEATEGVAIANLLRAHSANVRVTVYGLAASAASYIATAGDAVSMAPGSMMMVHDAWILTVGAADDLRSAADALDALSDSIASLYALKTGGAADDWRAVMRDTKWYTGAAAVAAGLADAVGLDPAPSPAPPVETTVPDDDDTALARAAAARFDLSMFSHLPAALAAPQTPADQPVTPSTDHKEADTMSDTLLDGLRKQLGLADDADEATVLAANAEALTEKADPPKVEPPKPAAKADEAPALPEGVVAISQAKLDALTAQAELGQRAHARQVSEDRDELIEAAMSAGKISRADSTRDVWVKEFARNFDAAKADLESLPARFPVGAPAGVAGSENHASADVWSDDDADALAGLAGLAKGSLR